MSLSQRFIGAILKGITIALFRVDDAQLAKVPPRGPLILVTNHVHTPEIPTLFLRLTPRPVTGMLLASRWDNPLFRWMLNSFHILPLKRGEADLAGLRRGLEMLEQGYIIIIDPEGTRSHTGILQQGRAGAVLMALRSGAPLIPVVHYGSENYKHNLRRLRRTDFHFAVGRIFRIKPQTAAELHTNREAIVAEVMAQMAALLPPQYRGAYAGVEPSEQYLAFDRDGDGAAG
jgi:1-acyl-sn-glycerol-3-phosphate acyltransferase